MLGELVIVPDHLLQSGKHLLIWQVSCRVLLTTSGTRR
jgi:hypothetical protein